MYIDSSHSGGVFDYNYSGMIGAYCTMIGSVNGPHSVHISYLESKL